jgi:hypothetical protein
MPGKYVLRDRQRIQCTNALTVEDTYGFFSDSEDDSDFAPPARANDSDSSAASPVTGSAVAQPKKKAKKQAPPAKTVKGKAKRVSG